MTSGRFTPAAATRTSTSPVVLDEFGWYKQSSTQLTWTGLWHCSGHQFEYLGRARACDFNSYHVGRDVCSRWVQNSVVPAISTREVLKAPPHSPHAAHKAPGRPHVYLLTAVLWRAALSFFSAMARAASGQRRS